MIRLGVNIDHVATLREARKGTEPSLVQAALIAAKSGADGITVHLREDRRHIQDQDVFDLKSVLKLPLNLEMSVAEDIVQIAEKVMPYEITLVPEKREELTTEGGLDVVGNFDRLAEITKRLEDKKTFVSLFIDPVFEHIQAARDLGATHIELHTGEYANAQTKESELAELDRLREGSRFATRLGLIVNAGHGLTLENVKPIALLPNINELNIGHSIIARAIFVGLSQAIIEMKEILT